MRREPENPGHVAKSWHEAGAPAMEAADSATRKMMLDGRVLVEEVSSSMLGTPFTQGMRGYDNVLGNHWGPFPRHSSAFRPPRLGSRLGSR